MFQVLDNGRLAQYPDCDVDKSWSNATFDSNLEAILYARKWLGKAYHFVLNKNFVLNTPVDYSGYGDTIEIRRS